MVEKRGRGRPKGSRDSYKRRHGKPPYEPTKKVTVTVPLSLLNNLKNVNIKPSAFCKEAIRLAATINKLYKPKKAPKPKRGRPRSQKYIFQQMQSLQAKQRATQKSECFAKILEI